MTFPITESMLRLPCEKQFAVATNATHIEHAVRVVAGLQYFQLRFRLASRFGDPQPNPLADGESVLVWKAIMPSLDELSILAESHGIDSTPLREIVATRSEEAIEALEPLLDRLDLLEQRFGIPEGKGTDPPDGSTESNRRKKPNGYTIADLKEQTGVELDSPISSKTWQKIYGQSGLSLGETGGAAASRRFSNREIEQLAVAAETLGQKSRGGIRNGASIASTWRQLVQRQ